MADSQWHAPGAQDPSPPVAPVPSLPVAPVPPTPQGYGPAPQPSGRFGGWAPPPRPGLIPLRPLSFGTILGAPYKVLRRNPRPTFGASLLIQGAIVFLTILVVGLVAFLSFQGLDLSETELSPEDDQRLSGAIGATVLSALVPIALSVVATGVLQGLLVLEAARQTVNERLRFAALWRRARGRIGAVAGWSALLSLSLLIGLGVVVAAIVAAALLAGDAIGVPILLGLLLGLGFVVVCAWLGTKLAFVPSVIMLERASIRTAVARSWTLSSGAFWKTFGTLLLVAAILNTASSIVSYPIQLIGTLVIPLIAPTGDIESLVVVGIALYFVLIAITLVTTAITLVIQSATTALLYIDRRIRLEGLDLELARFVEARQSGAAEVADPFESVAP